MVTNLKNIDKNIDKKLNSISIRYISTILNNTRKANLARYRQLFATILLILLIPPFTISLLYGNCN
jgi:hypothetical protein